MWLHIHRIVMVARHKPASARPRSKRAGEANSHEQPHFLNSFQHSESYHNHIKTNQFISYNFDSLSPHLLCQKAGYVKEMFSEVWRFRVIWIAMVAPCATCRGLSWNITCTYCQKKKGFDGCKRMNAYGCIWHMFPTFPLWS